MVSGIEQSNLLVKDTGTSLYLTVTTNDGFYLLSLPAQYGVLGI